MNANPQLVIGTAGHIDHGKSSLVRALTGIDPDRLPEEKARGITIDLGFAHARVDECDLYFVDVPGHERFIRNMVAGATGIDVALLVVAADDALMPQTREHAELLAVLGVRRCVIVLTKMDLVDEDWAGQVEAEARELLARLGLSVLASVRTAAPTGRGMDDLRALLAQIARGPAPATADATTTPTWFRLPVDRCFSVPGRGTVVTGSVWHGRVHEDDELELWPAGRAVRVRDLQTHNDARSAAAGRMRLALNLANVTLQEVRRGCELATPGYLAATRRFDARLSALRMPGRTPRTTMRVRLHIATSEVLAEVRLHPETPQPAPAGENSLADELGALQRACFAQIRTAEPIVCTAGQRFVLRDESASRTLGGGAVLDPLAPAWTSKQLPTAIELARLSEAAPLHRVRELLRRDGWGTATDARLAARGGLADAQIAAALRQELLQSGELLLFESGGEWVTPSRAIVEQAAAGLSDRLKALLAENPRWTGIPRAEWAGWMPRACPERLRPALADFLLAQRRFAVANGFVRPLGAEGGLADADQELLDAMLSEIEAGGFQPPPLSALKSVNPRNARRARELIQLATARGLLVRFDDELWMTAQRWSIAAALVANAIRERGPLTVADIRTLLSSSRKYIVPLCEAFDAAGITRRSGDLRGLGSKAPP